MGEAHAGSESSVKKLIIGMGNSMRGDDGAGLEVVRRLCATQGASAQMTNVDIREIDGEASDLLMAWEGYDHAVIVDAGITGAEPGIVRRFDVSQESLPAELGAMSTHAMGLTQAIELGRALKRLPRRLVVLIIEGKSFELGEKLCLEVEASIDAACEAVNAELQLREGLEASPIENNCHA